MKKNRYFITFFISLAVFVLLVWGMDLGAAETSSEVVKIISNGFAIVGSVLFCFGLILWVDNADGYRGFKLILYGAKKFFRYALPFLFQKELEATFFDYYLKKEKTKVRTSHLLFIGGGYLCCSILFAVIFEYF